MQKKKLLKMLISVFLVVCVIISSFVLQSTAASNQSDTTASSEGTEPTQTETKQDTPEPKHNKDIEVAPYDAKDFQNTPLEKADNFDSIPDINAISNLAVIGNTENSITLKWDPQENISGYNLYYKRPGIDPDYSFLFSGPYNILTIKNLEPSIIYDFKVAAYAQVGELSYEGLSQEISMCTKPAAIKGLDIVRCGKETEFSWKKQNYISGYEIERQCTENNGSFIKYDIITDPNINSYIDANVQQGKSYFYRVRSYLDFNGQTYYGKYATITTVAGLHAPKLKSVKTQVNRVTFKWDSVDYASGYQILYSTKKDSDFKELTTTGGTYYNSARLKGGTHYYFKIRAYKDFPTRRIYGSYKRTDKIVSKKAYGVNVGDTYIEISLEEQTMWFILDGKIYTKTAVVTGNVGARATPKGTYRIFEKQSPSVLVGDDYRTTVNYWLAFTYSGCGIHDSTWRSAYGGDIYTYDGSHGCVNTPMDEVIKIYEKAHVGNYVVVY